MTSSTILDWSLPVQRNWVSANSHTSGSSGTADSFVVVSYNILADCHVTTQTYPYLPEGYRTIVERHPQLLMELTHHSDADVICLQEVNEKYFKEILAPALTGLGYEGIHCNKARGIDEGPATFYKPSGFQLERHKVVYFKDQIKEVISKMPLPSGQSDAILERTLKETVTMYLRLRCKRTGKVLTLGNVHAYWRNHIAMDVITLQIALAVDMLVQFSDDQNSALMLCGDFNTQPHMPAYQLLRDGCLSDQGVDTLRQFEIVSKEGSTENFTLVDVMSASFQHPIRHFQSAYKTIMGAEVPFSQFHDTAGTEWQRLHQQDTFQAQKEQDDSAVGGLPPKPLGKRAKALDYLWFSAETLGCTGALEMVSREVLDRLYACPNAVFPSDHLLMKAKFCFKSGS